MDKPIFQTSPSSKLSSVAIYPDRLEHFSPLVSTEKPKSIPLDRIQQAALVPKVPGSDPRKIDLALRIEGEQALVVKDLDIEDARQIQSTIKNQRIQRPKKMIEEHPFTQAGRILKRMEERQRSRQQIKARSAPIKPLRLTFRRKV